MPDPGATRAQRGGRPDEDPTPSRSGRGGIFETQPYTPRGWSVREQTRTPTPQATPETPDPPTTLRVVDSGRADKPRTTHPPAARTAAGSDRTVRGAKARGSVAHRGCGRPPRGVARRVPMGRLGGRRPAEEGGVEDRRARRTPTKVRVMPMWRRVAGSVVGVSAQSKNF